MYLLHKAVVTITKYDYSYDYKYDYNTVPRRQRMFVEYCARAIRFRLRLDLISAHGTPALVPRMPAGVGAGWRRRATSRNRLEALAVSLLDEVYACCLLTYT